MIDADTHAELVRAMLAAGPLGIDAYLLVVAVDAGVTDETREHAALLRALGVESGLAVVSATDLADPEGVLRKTSQLLPGAPAHAVSLQTGAGLGALRQAVAELLSTPAPPAALPAARLAGPGPPLQTRVIDAALDFGPNREREPAHGTGAVVHLRGGHAAARLARLGGRFWQVRLAAPLPAAPGDRFVIRAPGATDPAGERGAGDCGRTLGGGVVLDPAARRHPTSNEVIVRLTRAWRGLPPLPDVTSRATR